MKRVNQSCTTQSHNVKGRWILAALVSGVLLEGGAATVAQADSTSDDAESETQSTSNAISSAQQSVTLSTKSQPATQSTTATTTNEQKSADTDTSSARDTSEKDASSAAISQQSHTTSNSQIASSNATAVTQSAVKTDNPTESPTPTPAQPATVTSQKINHHSLARMVSASAVVPDTTTPSDDQVVTFSDAYLASAVKKALALSSDEDITIGAIRHYAYPVLNIDATADKPAYEIGVNDLRGLEALSYLPQSTRIALYLTMTPYITSTSASPVFDFSPLTSLRFVALDIHNDYWEYSNNTALSQLTAIDPSTIAHVALTGYSYTNLTQYGLTNSQLAFLGPWLTAIGNNGCTYGITPLSQINLSGNAISDLSPLGGITATTQVVAIGETYIDNHIVNVVDGQPLTLTPTGSFGLDGTRLPLSQMPYSFNTDAPGKYRPITNLGNGQLYFSSANRISSATYENYITYGEHGFQFDSTHPNVSYIDVTYPTGAELIYDTRVFRLANWQAFPTVTVNYTDTQGNVIQAPTVLGDNAQVSDPYDLSDFTHIAGYTFVSGQTAKLTGAYTTDPQTVTLIFQQTPTTSPQTPTGFSEDDPTGLPTPPADEPTTPDQVAQTIVDQHPLPSPVPTAQTEPLTTPEKQTVTQLVLHGGIPNTIADQKAPNRHSNRRPQSPANAKTLAHTTKRARQARRQHTAARHRQATTRATLPQASDAPAGLATLLGLASLSLLGRAWRKRPR